jgi:pilus assembly protein FimV
MKKHVLASMVAAATMGILTPLTSHAFGLGKINVMSALNEPFKAEIDVTALRPEEKDNLQVRMASQSEFDKAGLSHSMLLNQMQFDIVQRGGQHKILITSKQAIKEPFLDFLVTATAGSGIMLREYTVLLDPPEYVLAETRPASTRPAPAPTQAAPVETTSSPTTTRYQYADSSSGFSGSSYKVKRSDTLWNIALDTRPGDDLTVHQMMMALQKRNPSAFVNENVNGLKAGVTLQIPSRNEIEALSSAAARQAFAQQNTAWKNRNRPAVTQVTQAAPEPVAPEVDAPAVESAEETQQAQETTPVQTAETSADAMDTPESRLQLVAPEDEVSAQQDASPNVQGNNELSQLTEQLTLAQETIEAQAQENIDLQQRMALLEEQIETMRRMISMEDTDLARMQAMLEDEAETAAESGETLAEAETPADMMEEAGEVEAASEPTEEAEISTATAEQETEAETAVVEEPTATNDEPESVVTKAAQVLNLDEAQVQSTIDKVKQFVADNKMPTVLGLLLVLLVLWLIARRSNREVTWDEAVKKMDKADSKHAAADVVAPEVAEELTDAPASSEPLSEEKTAAELVEQADMFVGYADYVQAKSSLDQARALEPTNSLVAYKTLFVLYKLNHADEFIELAEQGEFEKDSFEWSEIAQWGKELAPSHALFAEQAQSTPVQDEEPDATDLAFNDVENDAAEAIDLDLDAESVKETVEADATNIDFDLDGFATSSASNEDAAEAAADEPDTVASNQAEDDLLSFDTNFSSVDTDTDDAVNIDIDAGEQSDDDLSFDEVAETTADADSFDLETAEMPADTDSPDLEFDIGDLDDIDEAETKLDLASAYIDMGDPDGARSILNEVLVEGSDEQKNRAHELLESLS